MLQQHPEIRKDLKSEMAKSNAPTLFQVNGPVGLASWKDYCYDLKDSDVAKQLTSDDFALKDGDAVVRNRIRNRKLRNHLQQRLLKKQDIQLMISLTLT